MHFKDRPSSCESFRFWFLHLSTKFVKQIWVRQRGDFTLGRIFFPVNTSNQIMENKMKCLFIKKTARFCFGLKVRPLFLLALCKFKNRGSGGGWQIMIIPNMVNKTSTVLMTFSMGCNRAVRKFERHGRSPNKALVGGARGHAT